jgi:excinuclease ABC subunit C
VIDGGTGQLNAALAAAKDVGVGTSPITGIPGAPFVEMVGLAKSRLVDAATLGTARVVGRRAARGRGSAAADVAEASERGFVAELARTPERVFLPGRKDPVVLRRNSAELFLLERLRDEAHRFAITFHRKLRRERNFRSVLEDISGIGEGRKRALLRHFGSLKRVKLATAGEIAQVDGFGPKQAQAVHEFFHRPEAVPEAEEVDEAEAEQGGKPAGAEIAGPGGAAVTEEDIDAALAEEGALGRPEAEP